MLPGVTDRVQLVITEIALLGAGIFLLVRGFSEIGLTLIVAAVGAGGGKIALPALMGAASAPPQVQPPAPLPTPPAPQPPGSQP